MDNLLIAFFVIIAGLIGFAFTLFEFCTSEYPTTCSFLLKKSWKLYAYCIIFGVLSAIIMFLVLLIFPSDSTQPIMSSLFYNPLFQAIIIGISVKAIMHINIFSANLGTFHVPIGLETVCYIFEPYLLNQLKLDEYSLVMEYINTKPHINQNISDVKKLIQNKSPRTLTDAEWRTFKIDLEKRITSEDAMELFFRVFGKRNFDRIFRD
jgi:hypothetical protein